MFKSILFETDIDNLNTTGPVDAPKFFVDLHLDRIIETVIEGNQEPNLKPLFYAALKDIRNINYRQEIFQDLENTVLLERIKSFSHKMTIMQQHLALINKLQYKRHKEGWFLEAVDVYCEAVNCLVNDLQGINARGLLAFQKYLNNYSQTADFKMLCEITRKLKTDLSNVEYCLLIKGSSVKVRKCESEIDFSQEVERTFEKFKQGQVTDYTVKLSPDEGMSHVEAEILGKVAKLYPDVFGSLNNFCKQHLNYLDEKISNFYREIQFYIAFQDYITKLKKAGLKFCYPQIAVEQKDIFSYEGFDLALAQKSIGENSASIVCNDFYLEGKERTIILSGPEQGGKSTFARAFGQMHYLARLGCPVPGSKARLLLTDNIYVLFEKEEDIKDLHSKLEDDLIRIYKILNLATSNSIILIDRIFSSTTLKDAIFLSKKIMERLKQLDVLCVWISSIEESAGFSNNTVSMVSSIISDNPMLRTYKIVRKPAGGPSYAISIADKYRVTYDWIKGRIKS